MRCPEPSKIRYHTAILPPSTPLPDPARRRGMRSYVRDIVFVHELLQLLRVAETHLTNKLAAGRGVLSAYPSPADEVRDGVRERADACQRKKASDQLRDDVGGEHIT